MTVEVTTGKLNRLAAQPDNELRRRATTHIDLARWGLDGLCRIQSRYRSIRTAPAGVQKEAATYVAAIYAGLDGLRELNL